MELVERVLIHPLRESLGLREYHRIWQYWASLPTTHIIPNHDFISLEEIGYLDLVIGRLTVGGQAGGECVKRHLIVLAQAPRITDGSIDVFLSRSATLTGIYDIDSILEQINNLYGVGFLLTE